jgi:hypothetical protein
VRSIDAYLTRKARLSWPSAVVYKEPDGAFTLERAGQPRLGLGASFGLAREALAQLRRETP